MFRIDLRKQDRSVCENAAVVFPMRIDRREIIRWLSAGLDGLFEHVLSSDRIRTFKPDSRAYRMAVDAFDLPARQVLFVAFAGWDVAGAKWFGNPVYWVNRLAQPAEPKVSCRESRTEMSPALGN